jgi:hypothetical protein
VINFVQRREQLTTSRSCLSTMTMRVAEQVGPPEACEQLVETGRIGFVEMMYTPKCVSRAVADIHIRAGNHLVEGVPGDAVLTDRLACLHAPLRSRSVLETKVEQGRRVAEASFLPGEAWHVHRWRRLAAEGALDEEWRANSYRDAALDVGDHRRPLVRDTRLADAVAPWTRRARWRR